MEGSGLKRVRTGPVRTERVQSGLLTSVCNSVYALLSELAIEYIVIINLSVFIYENDINTIIDLI